MNQEHRKIINACSITGLVGFLVTGFSFTSLFLIGLIWAGVSGVIYQETKATFPKVYFIVSLALMFLGGFSMYMEMQ